MISFDHGAKMVELIIILVLGFFGRQKLEAIHVLVNSRLTLALEEIQSLKDAKTPPV